MADTKNYGLKGVGNDVQFGKAGGHFVFNTGASDFRATTDGTTLAHLQVLTPVGATDAATKLYVDNTAAGLDPKASVTCATTADLGATYAAGGGAAGNGQFTVVPATLDGVTLAAGDRVLVKDQSTATQNGIYVVTGTTTIIDRATDHDSNAEVNAGNFTFVEEGTANRDTGWVLQGPDPLTINTSGLTWVQFSTSGTILGGVAITKNGNTLDLDIAGTPVLTDAVATGDSVVMFNSANGGQAIGTYETTVDQLKTFMNAGTSATSITEGNSTLSIADAGAGTLTTNIDATDVIVTNLTTTTFQNGNDILLNTASTLTITDLTSTRVVLAGTAGLIEDSINLTFDGTTLTTTALSVDNINVNGDTISNTNLNSDVIILPNGTGVISVLGTTNYEANVTLDDDIPNKLYVDNTVAANNNAGSLDTITGVVDMAVLGVQNIGAATGIPANATIMSVTFQVTDISDAATTVIVGDTINGTASYMTATENDPQVLGTYIADTYVANAASARQAIATVAVDSVTTASATVIITFRHA